MADDTVVDPVTPDTSTSTDTSTTDTSVDKTTDTTTKTTTDTTVDTSTDTPTETSGTDTSTEDDVAAKALDWNGLKEKYAKGDDKLLARLNRYSSPEAVVDALLAAQKKIAEGVRNDKPDPKKATPEELAEWRAANGIPETPDAYTLSLSDDVVLGEEDQQGLSGFLEVAHELDLPADKASRVVDWFLHHKEQEIEQLTQRDVEAANTAIEELREEWGTDYKLNKNLISNLLDSAPEGVKEEFLGARMPDGSAVFNNPQFLRFMANLARTVNPTATITPATGMTTPQAIQAELDTLNSMMGDKNSAYWKGPAAEKNQARYRQLIEAQERYK